MVESVRWVAVGLRWVVVELRWVVVELRWVVAVAVAASPAVPVEPRWVVPVVASLVGPAGLRWVVAEPRWVVAEPQWVVAVELLVSGSRRQVAVRFRWAAAAAADLPVPVLDSVAGAFSLRSVTIPRPMVRSLPMSFPPKTPTWRPLSSWG